MSDQTKFRRFLDWMNEEGYYTAIPPSVKWMFLVSLLLVALFLVATTTSYLLFDLPSQRAVIACQAKGMNAARPDFSRDVTCLPRYRGADSLNLSGVK